jgi:U3 small nucleolar RNA-associated protein 19
LQTHYQASISTLAKIFTEVFTKPQFNMEDFLDHGYGTLFDTEIQRKIRNPPALSIALESDQLGELFPNDKTEEEVRDAGDIVGQLWSF